MSFENAKRRYIQEKARFSTGYGEVSYVKGIYETFVLLYVASSIADFNVPSYLYVVLPIACIFGLWIVGYLWDRSHMYHLSAEFSNNRNYFVKEMRKAMKGKGLNKT